MSGQLDLELCTVPRGEDPEVIGHLSQPNDFAAQQTQVVGSRLGEPVLQGLKPGLEHGDRCAQLVSQVAG
ncbi:MAG TPA: hypothetical protein VF506_18360, partial [Streptosporangiaceae bacterium]